MRIGILSDTHGNLITATAGVRALEQAGVEFFIHCGDVGSTEVLDLLAGHQSAFVFGNCDWDRRELERYANDIGIQCLANVGELELSGKRIAVTHGDDGKIYRRILDEQTCDYLFYGHTHIKADRREGRIRIINPGALHRATVKTVAVVDVNRDELSILDVKTK
jgi:putative phosphoesterase